MTLESRQFLHPDLQEPQRRGVTVERRRQSIVGAGGEQMSISPRVLLATKGKEPAFELLNRHAPRQRQIERSISHLRAIMIERLPMPVGPPFTRLIRDLPATVPFVAPDAIERQIGRTLRLRLGANESLFGPSPRAVEAMRSALDRISLYGDPESATLRAELASMHRVSPDNIVICSGIDDLIGLAVRAFVDPGTVAVTSLGAYPTFEFHVLGFGGRLQRVAYRDDANDLSALAEMTRRSGARVVYLANPDNPSGTWHDAPAVQDFIDHIPSDALLLLDEAYIEYAPTGTAPSIDASDPRLLRMRTFSKAYGMAGARIGYGIGAAETIAAFDKIRHHFGVNAIAQAGALAALGDHAHLQSVIASVADGRRDYEQLARSLGLATLPSATNFVAIDVGSQTRAQALLGALQERGVFVRMPRAPPLDRCVRVTIAPVADRVEFARIFETLFSE